MPAIQYPDPKDSKKTIIITEKEIQTQRPNDSGRCVLYEIKMSVVPKRRAWYNETKENGR